MNLQITSFTNFVASVIESVTRKGNASTHLVNTVITSMYFQTHFVEVVPLYPMISSETGVQQQSYPVVPLDEVVEDFAADIRHIPWSTAPR